MILTKVVDPYLISQNSSLGEALTRLNHSKSRALVVIDEHCILQGILTVGDINRWMLLNGGCNVDDLISKAVNRDCYSLNFDSFDLSVDSNGFNLIPLVDSHKHVKAIALRDESAGKFYIGESELGEGKVFTIAEIGNNHNGSLARAKQLIDLAAESGANCAKFQLRDMESLYGNEVEDDKQNLGAQYTLDLLRKFQLDNAELLEAMSYAKDKGLVPMCTPWDEASVDLLERFGVPAYKVASADLTNHGLLKYIARTGKPMICSTGMATEEEILESVLLLKSVGAKFVLLHCNSTYPTPFKDVNLSYLKRLKEISNGFVGYSGHERDIHVAISAVALGACVIEKHFTLDRSMEGNDHKVSLLPPEFSQMTNGIKQVSEALGKSGARALTQGEMMNRVTLAKSVYAARDLSEGEVLSRSDLVIKSPGHGLQPNKLSELIGRKLQRSLKEGEVFYPMDLQDSQVTPRDYDFWSNWGLPVRHHDYLNLYNMSKPPVLEFHLSYKDLELDNDDYFDGALNAHLVVHAPELFEGDHTLDLTSPDEEYRQLSIKNMKRTIDAAVRLKPYFNNCDDKVGIVTNVGGFSSSGPLSELEKEERIEILKRSLSELQDERVQIWPQTMPPYPWHFGGQQYHNLFLDAESIAKFCDEMGMKVCLDISHSILQCNLAKESPSLFLEKVLPYSAHLHLADGEGVDGEGLQIGEGDVDFHMMAEKVKELCPEATWIPEIWQGHEENGKGFWLACERLEEAGF